MKHTTLLLGQDPEIMEFLKAILDRDDNEITIVHSVAKARAQIQETLPDLLIADLDTTEENIKFFNDIKKRSSDNKLAILLLAPNKKTNDVLEAAAIDDLVIKPINAALLVSKVENLLGKSSPMSQSLPKGSDSALGDDILFETDDAAFEKRKKILLFGLHDTVLSNMSRQLKKEECHVTMIKDESKVIPEIERLKPDLIFLELRSDLPRPIDSLIFGISAFIKERTQEFGSEIDKAKIIVYKSEEVPWLSADKKGADDIEELIGRCKEFWDVQYMGIYNAMFFIPKIKGLLK